MRKLLYVLIIINIIMGCKQYKLPDNLAIAHRGMPHHAPEETIPSYILARELGANYLEADLQRTKDGVIIALHDDNLQRTTNINNVYPERSSNPVSQFTWSEIQQLDAGSWFNRINPEMARDSYIGLKIISLEILIDIAEQGKNCGLYLETKHPDLFPGIEKDLKELLQRRGWYQQKFSDDRPKVILQTFSSKSLELLYDNFPETPLCYLWWEGEGCLESLDQQHVEKCLEIAVTNGASIIGPSFSGEQTHYKNLLEPWVVEMIKKKGLQIHAYTFDTESDIKKYAPFCQGQFTNRTDLLLEFYSQDHKGLSRILDDYNY